ncbi:Dbl homology domain-containing protein, partial [Blyttiomyces helicus]
PAFSAPEPAFSAPALTPAAPAPVLFKARCLFEFTAVRGDDLALVPGDVVPVTKEDGEWLFGATANGREGWFPRNFVEVVNNAAVDPHPSILAIRTPPPPDPPSPTVRAEILWDYSATRPDELTVAAGEFVLVLDKPETSWWRVERSAGGSGLVPATYLRELDPDEPAGAAPPPVVAAPISPDSGSPRSTIPPSLPKKPTTSKDQHAHVGFGPRSSSLEDSLPPKARPSPGGMSRSASASSMAGLAQSWVQAVDPSLLTSIHDDERKRQEAIFELIGTERSYVRDLQLIVEVFYGPLSQFLSKADLHAMFGNIEDLLLVNSLILSDLEAKQIQENYVVSGIGEIFVHHTDSLVGYSAYCSTISSGLKLLQKRRVEDPRLNEYLKSQQLTNDRCRSLDLSTFLLAPMQRITRYTLLFRQILHYTPVGHPDHEPIQKALERSVRAADKVNAAAKEEESRAKIEEISAVLSLECPEDGHRLNLHAPTRHNTPRLFIHEGPLQKSKSGRKLYGYLFNDLLVLAQPKGKTGVTHTGKEHSVLYRKPFLLADIHFQDMATSTARDLGALDESCFQIVQGDDSVTLRAPSAAAKRKWLSLLEEQQILSTVLAIGAATLAVAIPILSQLYVPAIDKDLPSLRDFEVKDGEKN